MSTNRAENTLLDRLVNMLTEHDRALRELKTGNQPIGADTLDIRASATTSVGPVTVPAGGWMYVGFLTTPGLPILTLFNFEISLYVDGNTFNDRYPNGSNLSAGATHASFNHWLDYDSSNDVNGVRLVKVRVNNLDTVSHNYYINYEVIVPHIPVT